MPLPLVFLHEGVHHASAAEEFLNSVGGENENDPVAVVELALQSAKVPPSGGPNVVFLRKINIQLIVAFHDVKHSILQMRF